MESYLDCWGVWELIDIFYVFQIYPFIFPSNFFPNFCYIFFIDNFIGSRDDDALFCSELWRHDRSEGILNEFICDVGGKKVVSVVFVDWLNNESISSVKDSAYLDIFSAEDIKKKELVVIVDRVPRLYFDSGHDIL